MPKRLFEAWKLRGVSLRNRIGVSPMCQYSCEGGLANDWHLVHLGSRASGGAALVIAEATAVAPEGRISPEDLGLWSDAHIEPLARVARFVAAQGAVAGIQIAHAGRKAGVRRPWSGGQPLGLEDGGWPLVGPSPISFGPGFMSPSALDEAGLAGIRAAFTAAARRADLAGFGWLELHSAHGYLLHSFLSPLSNRREDRYGGAFENRIRLLLETTKDVRAVWPEAKPLAVRLSCTDWLEGGWTLDESVELARLLKGEGVDLIDCSSAGAVPSAPIPVGPGYQVPLAARIRREAGIPTAAVGLISEARQAESILDAEEADLILLGRESLRDPYWPIHAALALGAPAPVPPQYHRGYPAEALQRPSLR